jgi:hypothetical protein
LLTVQNLLEDFWIVKSLNQCIITSKWFCPTECSQLQINTICPCIFIKKSESGFAIITVYVDDLNLVGTPEELTKTATYLKNEFEMTDLEKTKFCLGLQIEHFQNGILVHQSTYTEKVLRYFYMEKAHPLSTPMVVQSLDVKKDPFRPREDDK